MGRVGRAPFSQFSSTECSSSPTHGTRQVNATVLGDTGRAPKGGQTSRLVPQHTPVQPHTQPSSVLPPQRRHSHAQQCRDTSGNTTLVESWCLRQKRALWGRAAPAPGCSQHRPFPSVKRLTPQHQQSSPAQKVPFQPRGRETPHVPS